MSQQTPEQLAATIAALEAQRALFGDAMVDSALAPLREKLAALRAPEIAAAAQQLKQVSVLSVDVVGSTAMGQRLDPETIHEVMDGALERFTAAVQAEGGRVLQYTGDGMLAAFGTEAAGEDDVECAIRAGLRIVDAAQAHAPQVRLEHGVPDFNVRVGVHTGRVLLGGGVDAEGSIRGATVNVAARMEQSAPPGRLRISHDSWRHVRGMFEFEPQPPISANNTITGGLSSLFGNNSDGTKKTWDEVVDSDLFSFRSSVYDLSDWSLAPDGEITIQAAAVPEPASFALVLLALATMLLASRRRAVQRSF